MLLNKLPCLDKGWVALVKSMNDHKTLQELHEEFRSPMVNLQRLAHATIIFRCPMFVEIALNQYGFTMVGGAQFPIEAYLPNAGEIGSPDRQTNEAIADDIERTTAALLINPKAYKADGCDSFTAGLMTPWNLYTTTIVSGTLEQWRKFANKGNLPAPVESYRLAVKQIIDTEWR